MTRIVIIGAGSGFGGKLSIDILSRPPLQDSVIGLCDIDDGRLKKTAEYVQRTIDSQNLPAKVLCEKDYTRLLEGADFVITSVSVGGRAYWGRPFADEINIPAKYGVDQAVGDTVGPGGVFRFLRTAPVQLEFCRQIERRCPDALLLNYTNPMAMLTWLHSAASSVRNVGLCHSVQNTAKRLAKYTHLPLEEVSYLVAGLNHQSWFLEFRHNGQDAYPLIRKAMEDPEIYRRDTVRFDILKHFGYFVTESTPHNSEYLPYFRRTPALRERYSLKTRTVAMEAPVKHEWLKDTGADETAPVGNISRSHEYASAIIEAKVTDRPIRFNGNVMNTGLITNLPEGCCVEVPCLVDGLGVHPCHVGALPPQCAALNRSNVAVQELAVRAVLERDRDAAFQAVALDPLTASVLSLDEIRAMFDEMWQAEEHLLGYFQ